MVRRRLASPCPPVDDILLRQNLRDGRQGPPHIVAVDGPDAADAEAVDLGDLAGIDGETLGAKSIVKSAEIIIRVR